VLSRDRRQTYVSSLFSTLAFARTRHIIEGERYNRLHDRNGTIGVFSVGKGISEREKTFRIKEERLSSSMNRAASSEVIGENGDDRLGQA